MAQPSQESASLSVRAVVSETIAAFAHLEVTPRDERNELEFAVLFNKEDNILNELIRSKDIEFFEKDNLYGVFVGNVYRHSIETSLKVGRKVLLKNLRDACIRDRTSSRIEDVPFLVVKDNKVRLPANLESAADSQVHKLMLLYSRLGVKMEIEREKCSVPTFSQGWQTNMTYILDLVFRLHSAVLRTDGPKEKLPTRLSNEFGKLIVKVLIYKWANKKNLSAYLKEDVKKEGNISGAAFTERMKSWGTPVENNIGGDIASAIYGLISDLANHSSLQECLPKTMFLSGVDLRKDAEPPRQIVEKTGKKTQIVRRGEINVLRFDNIRFLMPSERAALKKFNESGDIENYIRRFDEIEIKDRKYPEFLELLKKKVSDNSIRYFSIRRQARQRLYAVKEVRREAKQTENVPDSDFASNSFIETVCTQAESILIDLGRRRSVLDRLRSSIVPREEVAEQSPSEEVN